MSPPDPRREHLERLVRQCSRRGWAVAFSLLRNHDDAMDAVQQAFLVAARKPDRIPTDDPWPWFGVVVAHEARNIRKKKRPVTNLGEGLDMPADDRADPSSGSEREEARRRLRTALEALPERERDAVVLTHMTGMSHALAAEALDIPRQTLSAQVRRGLDRLATRLCRKPEGVAHSLGLLPVAAPPCGWEAATATWTEAAVGSLSASTAASTAATSAAIGGLALMSSKTVLLLALAAVAGLGFLGGTLVEGSPLGERARVEYAAESTLFVDPSSVPAAAEGVSEDVTLKGAVTPGDLQREIEDLRTRLAQALAHGEAVEKRLAEIEQPHVGPTFTFGRMGQLDAVTGNNWKESGRSARIIAAGVLKVLETRERGEQVPASVHLELQENADRMRKYEFRTYGKMPTAAKYNGENTHPITMANLLAAMLEDAGKPLSADQVKRINALGLAFEDDYERLLSSFNDAMPRVERLLAEYRTKGRFIDDVVELLTSEQREAVVPPGVHRVTGLDINSPTQMIAYTSPILVGPTVENIRSDLRGLLAKKLALDEEGAAVLDEPISEWMEDVRELVETPVPQTRLRHYTYGEAEIAGEATVRLTQRLLRDLDLSDAQRTTLMTDHGFYIPRLVKS